MAELRRKAAARTGGDFLIIVIQEAGLDGFWIHRVLQSEGIESHVVDDLTPSAGPDRSCRIDREPDAMAQPADPQRVLDAIREIHADSAEIGGSAGGS